jgi:hypothetical protein
MHVTMFPSLVCVESAWSADLIFAAVRWIVSLSFLKHEMGSCDE